MSILSAGQIISSLFRKEGTTVGAGEEMYEVAREASGIDLDEIYLDMKLMTGLVKDRLLVCRR